MYTQVWTVVAATSSPTELNTACLTLRRRYASLYFCCAVEDQDNELITLEIIHRYVELLDKYFGSVSLSSTTCNMPMVNAVRIHNQATISSDMLLFVLL